MHLEGEVIVRDIYSHVIGQIENGTFKKRIWGHKHFLREPEPAIAIDAVAFDSIISRHAGALMVIGGTAGNTSCPFAFGRPRSLPRANYFKDKQLR